MAYNNSAPAAATAATNDNWKATAFLNVFVNRADGSKMKVGAIALKAQRRQDKAIIDRLQEEGGLQALKEKLVLDFQMADSGTPAEAGF
jgi:hypothetical protein